MMLAFEVMDKEPTLLTVWGVALGLGVLGFAATRFRRWLVVPALGIVAIAAWIQLGKLADPVLGPAIMQQTGRMYLIHSCAAAALAAILPVMGLLPRKGAV
jgi:hypothetical protein